MENFNVIVKSLKIIYFMIYNRLHHRKNMIRTQSLHLVIVYTSAILRASNLWVFTLRFVNKTTFFPF